MPYPNPTPGDAVLYHSAENSTTMPATITGGPRAGYVDLDVSENGATVSRMAIPFVDTGKEPPRFCSWASWPV